MPSARANMSAKFIAQIEISKPWVRSASNPAEASRPSIVSSSGRPAATREPKASTRIASVTGQEKSSDFIIAVRLAALKSDHIPEAPVRLTETLPVASWCSLPFSLSAAATIAVGSFLAPATMRAVWPSREIETPADGATTFEMCGSARRIASALATTERNAGDLVVSVEEWTTTIGAELARPPKLRWTRLRACTDCDPFACQPAPESAVSTFGANTARVRATTAQAIETTRTWSAAQRPRRPIGPTASGCSTGNVDGAEPTSATATTTFLLYRPLYN